MKKYLLLSSLCFAICLNLTAQDINKNTTSDTLWFQQNSGTNSLLQAVFFTDPNHGWAVGAWGSVALRTTDGGNNWYTVSIGTTEYLFSVFFINSSIGWIAGDNGVVVKTTNGGDNWFVQTSGSLQKLRSIYFVDADTGWAAGDNSSIYKSTNGGANWYSQANGTGQHLISVFFISKTTGWVSGNSGALVKTTNGGINWFAQSSGLSGDMYCIHFEDLNTGWVVGMSGAIKKTTNGGSNWFSQSSGVTEGLGSIYFTSIDNGCIAGGSGKILRTTDSGNNWFLQASRSTKNFSSVFFLNDSLGWIVGQDGEILKSIQPVQEPPSAPTNLTASAVSSNQINLSWTASISGSPTKYRVFRSLTSGSGFVQVDSVNSTSTVYYNRGLNSSTDYYYKVYAVNAIGMSSASNTANDTTYDTFTDPRDGRVYDKVVIGSQVWMAENLNYRTTSGSWYYNDDSATYASQYGRLYDWNTALTVAPPGWHLPSKTEYETLFSYLGGIGQPAYYQMIVGGASGYEAIFSGSRDGSAYYGSGTYALHWTSTPWDGNNSWFAGVSSTGGQYAYLNNYLNSWGRSVRCIKDPDPPSAPSNLTASAVSSNQINLSWTASISGSPTKYRVFRSLTSGSGFSQIDSVNHPTTSYINKNLNSSTDYYYQVYAVGGTGMSSASNTVNDTTLDTFTDPRDGRVYNTVKVGNQIWLGENLNYRTASGSWYYNNDSATYASQYGRLYDWSTALTVAPPGWHLATKSEWDTLLYYLGGAGTTSYYNIIVGGSSGYNVKFGGFRNGSGSYLGGGISGLLWSATESNTNASWMCDVRSADHQTQITTNLKTFGHSVRCIKDELPTAPSALTASGIASNQINVKWTASSSGPPTKYRIFRSLTPSEGFVQIDSVNSSTTSYYNRGLNSSTAYYYIVYAVNSLGMSLASNMANDTTLSTFTDIRDGRIYNTVMVGNQQWMAENLNYRTMSGSWYFNNDSVTYSSVHGRLYDWTTALTVAPPGWHLPSKTEFDTLLSRLGGSGWNAYYEIIPSGASGFNAIFSGYRHYNGSFGDFGTDTYYWTNTEYDGGNAWGCDVRTSMGAFMNGLGKVKTYGFSVRCIKDSLVIIPSEPTNLTATAVSSRQINLVWTTSSSGNPTKYRIFRSLTSGSGYIPIDSVNHPTTSYYDRNLNSSTDYYYRVYAVNGSGISPSSNMSNDTTLSTFTDLRDGRTYNTVIIGNQIWMADNLNYRTTSGSWYYNDDSTAYAANYGRLYDWATALSVAPSGWHIPTKTEWDTMLIYLGGSGTPAYNNIISGGSSGFDARFGGCRYDIGYYGLNNWTDIWSSTEYNSGNAWRCGVNLNTQHADMYYYNKIYAFSVRCVKDYSSISVENYTSNIPKMLTLYQNYPNPFNPSTTITYDLPNSAFVRLKIYNLLGQEIRTLINAYELPGRKSVIWDGSDSNGNSVATGIYLYRLEVGDFSKTMKLMLIK